MPKYVDDIFHRPRTAVENRLENQIERRMEYRASQSVCEASRLKVTEKVELGDGCADVESKNGTMLE